MSVITVRSWLTPALAELDNPQSVVPARLVSPKANEKHGHLERAGSRDAVFRRPAVHSYRLRGPVHTRKVASRFRSLSSTLFHELQDVFVVRLYAVHDCGALVEFCKDEEGARARVV